MRYTALLSIFSIILIFSTPNFAKKAAIIIDYDTQEVLFEVNADTGNYPASLTKIMTIYIVFDYIKKNKLTWNTKLSVSKHAASQPRSKIYVEEGTFISVNKAIDALIIKSANDVATVVAENISGSEIEFAKLMNKYAKKIGMKNTTFKNASGLGNRAQLTTARDITILSRALISNFPEYYKLFNDKKFTWKNKTFTTHNRLMLNYDGADGIKTGYIKDSGFQLAFSAVKNNKRLIGVYFGGDTAKQRDQRLAFLMDRGFGKLKINNTKKATKIDDSESSDKFKIVVGTFKYKKNAEKQIKVIQKNYPKTTQNKKTKVVKIKINNGYLYESRFQFFSKKEAKISCNRLKMYNRDCFIRD